MPRHIKIALIGGFHVGKTSTAKLLGEHFTGKGFEHCHLSFATPLREELADALATEKLSREQILHEMTDENLKAGWRHILQFWGTEVRRYKFGQDYWVERMVVTMQAFKDNHPDDDLLFTSDDCRFANERAALVQEGFKFVRLSNHGDLDRATRHDSHASEQEWRHWKPDITVPWREEQSQRMEQIAVWLESKFKEKIADEVPDEAEA
jgi:hypothetical protein